MILRGRLAIKSHDDIGSDTGIIVQNDTIVDVDKFDNVARREGNTPVRDFGGIILPCLINAHTHLELSPFSNISHKDFVDWVLKLMDARAARTGQNSQRECLNAKHEAEECGTAYFVNVGNDYDLNLSFGNNQLFQFEQIGINNSDADKIFERSLSFMSLQNGIEAGLAVHAPYSVSSELMKKIKACNNSRSSITSIHLAEIPEEVEFIRTGKGRLVDLLNARVANWRFDATNLSPVEYVDSLGILDERTLCVHCIFVDDNDLNLIAQRGSAVAFCVRSNRELSGRIPDLKKFLKHGIRILLGTDSRASSPDIDMFLEAAAFYNEYHDVASPADIFRMATSDAANFLGIEDHYGKIASGMSASLVHVPFDGKAGDAFEFLVTDGKGKAKAVDY
ncbi:MAG: amidohydrolase family protein [Candidatus Kryptoniota bacterium]